MKSYEIANSCATQETQKNQNNSSEKSMVIPVLLSFGLMFGQTFLSEWDKLVKSKIR